MQKYLIEMSIRDGRIFFASRAEMLRTVRMSFKSMYGEDDLRCVCGEYDQLSHLSSCLSYSHLKEGLRIEESDLHLVRYYQRIINERLREEERAGSVTQPRQQLKT